MTLWWWSGHHADHHGIMMIILAWHYDDHHGMAFAVHHTRKRWWVFLSLSLLWLSKLQNLSSRQNQIVIDMLSLCCLLIPKRSADTQRPLLPSSLLNAFPKLILIVNCLSDLHQLWKESCHCAGCEPLPGERLVHSGDVQCLKARTCIMWFEKVFFAALVII